MSVGTPQAAVLPNERRRYLFGPLVDFLCLGGASLLILPLFFFLPDTAGQAYSATTIALVLSYIFNAQHFANSYQIFYSGFGRKAFGRHLSLGFRLRYINAGIVFPLALAVFIAVALRQPDPHMLAYVGNLYLLFIGWHYTKQGYGILIVDSVYKRRFFNAREKRVLRYNSLACWWLFWALSNYLIRQQNYWGISYYAFPLPKELVQLSILIAFITTAASLWVLARRALSKQRLPAIGVMAYLTTVYLWVFGLIHPLIILIVPTFHALQYQAVVWRYEINKEASRKAATIPLLWRLAAFAALGLLLGYLGFTGIPKRLDAMVDYNQQIFGATLFFFIFRGFINVHHFVMDNVIWRGDNPEAAAYLFYDNVKARSDSN